MLFRTAHSTLILALLLLFWAEMPGQVVISEVSPQEDWIELRNDGLASVNLDGYQINDEFDGEFWTFPELVLQPEEHLLIQASGLNRPYLPINWQCPVVESVNWDYILPTSNPNGQWMLPGATLTGWSSGPGGLGYSDGDDATVIPQTNSVYMRHSFTIEEPADWGYMSLAIDYDDGFVAYLNGIEIARSQNMSGVAANYDSYASENHEATMYTGGQPEQFVWNEDEFLEWLLPGENVLAIKSYNVGPNSSDLSIRPFLGFTPKDPTLTVWPTAPSWWPEIEGELHTDFQIGLDESVVLKNPLGEVINAIPIHPQLPAGFSVGREPGDSENWCIFENPSPGQSNAGQTCFAGIAATPAVTPVSGWYEGEITVQLTPGSEEFVVRYTTNGDEPNENSPVFPTSGLNLAETSALSLKSWSADGTWISGEIRDETYIIDEFTPDVPTFSILTNDEHLWNWNTGIYVFGPNASGEYPHFGANFWQPWSRFSRLLFFDESGMLQARETLDLEIHGGWSRAEPQRSFRLDFKAEYSGDFEWPIFDESPEINTFNNLNLRNGGQHSWATKFQDGLISTLANETHNIASAWQPVHLYLNGEYWGMYAAREKTDEHFIASHYNTDPDDVDLMGPFALLSGSDESFYEAANYLQSAPTSSSGFFPYFESHFDVENYIDYFVFETYAQNTDWMGIAWGLNNVKAFRSEPSAPWRYLLYDTDACFGFFGANVNSNFINQARNPGFPNAHSNLFDRVLDNETFRHRFINRYADLINTIFQSEPFNDRVNDCMNQMSSGMNHHIDRWNSPASYGVWMNSIFNLTSHNTSRIGTARDHIMSSFGLPNAHECTLESFPPLAGKVRVNTITPGPLPWDGIYFEDCPIELEAIAEPGWMFDQWDINSHVVNGAMDAYEKTTSVELFTNDLYRARFEPCPEGAVASITENIGGLAVLTSEIPFIDSVLWSLDGVVIGSGITWWPEAMGNYTAEVIFDGCSVVTGPYYTNGTGVPALPTYELKIAPNPAMNSVSITPSAMGPLRVFNALGQEVFAVTEESVMPGLAIELDVKNWPGGIYYVHSGPEIQKLVIQR
ncbi:MAG: CotH kinase family protein [Flavobacteriales bacterium]